MSLINPQPVAHAIRILTAAVCLLIERTHGDVISLSASMDNTLFQDAEGDQSSGMGESIFAGRTGARNDFRIRRATIAFDLAAAIPSNAMISGATLRLFLEDAGQNATGTTASLHALTANWGEGTSIGLVGNPGVATVGDATWLHRFYDTAFWSQPGGDFDPQSSAFLLIGSASQFYEWTGTALVADVQRWAGNPASNFGWILTGEEGDVTTALRFDSRESTASANRPQLIISYTVVPEAVSPLAGGALLLLRRAPRRSPVTSHELSCT
jgi:hypothetical protein